MTTRRHLLKMASALSVAAAVPALPAQAASLQQVAWEDLRYIGTPLTGGILQMHIGHEQREVGRHFGIDQDIDGTWCAWVDRVGPGDDEDRPAEGSITIDDPVIAHFLEQLHALLLDPIAFGHQ
jgi:hypothetical protein